MNCEKYELTIGEGKSMRSLAKTIGKMRTHERKCGKKKSIISSVLGIDVLVVRHDIFIPAFVGDGGTLNGSLILATSSMPPRDGLVEVQRRSL